MASSMQDEEVHHRKEEDALHEEPEQLDLNIEAKTDDEAKHKEPELDLNIEAKKQKVEQEIKDANQEDESRGGTYDDGAFNDDNNNITKKLNSRRSKGKGNRRSRRRRLGTNLDVSEPMESSGDST
ncbi:hypothetical protein Bca52824_009090 [Brassica carinata]|uniref:Uncharacterized protein n=1 Tax=Brassica carinata TaxID=52824 RepID=A0A8X8B9F9_BRACI|nr:hypothetical protein Bca52824_009090 [Brassica carinata]